MIVEIVGWLGSLALAACGVPLLVACLKERSIAKNLSMAFLQLWLWGEVLVIAYATLRDQPLLPVLFNCLSNIICIAVILWLRWRPIDEY